MTAIVMNTKTGAVTEHSITANSVTPNYFGNDNGLMAFGGADDNGEPIDAQVMTGKTTWGSTLKKLVPENAFVSISGSAGAHGAVLVEIESGAQYTYPFAVLASGESLAKLGRGIRENRLALGFANIGGADFRLDALELPVTQSDSRRT